MSRWFRWYEGTTEDGKFRVVARMSRVTVRDVLALWAFILEDAAHLDHRGVCTRNEDFMAAILDFQEGEVETILQAMEEAKMISVGMGNITVCNWDKRQFESDADSTATDRQRRKRARDTGAGHEPVTRDTATSDTDSEAETEKKEVEARVPRSPPKRGTRIPEDFAPSPSGAELATKLGLNLQNTLAKFQDHWTAATGQTATKLDWDAAWRTWCRREVEFSRNKPSPPGARGAYAAPAPDDDERRLQGYAEMIKKRVPPGQKFTSADRFKLIKAGLVTMEDCEKAGCAA